MKKISSFSLIKQTIIYSSIVVLFAFIITSFCFFIGYRDIPLGILLGGGFSIFAFSLYLYKENKMEAKKAMHYTIFAICMMSVIHALALIISALVTYVGKIQLFNIFSTFVAIFIPTIVFAIVSLLEGRKKDGSNC